MIWPAGSGALPAVVEDHVAVTGGAHAIARHGPDDADDQGLVDGDAEGVVRVEAEDGTSGSTGGGARG